MNAGRTMILVLAGVLAVGLVAMSASHAVAGKAGGGNATLAKGAGGDRPLVQFLREHFAGLAELKPKLNVTDEQRQAIRGIVKDHRDEFVPLLKEVVAKRRVLRQAVIAEQPSEEAIRAAADALGEAIGDVAVAASGIVGEVKGELTAEQLEIIRQFRQERAAAVDELLDGASQQ